VSETPYTQQDLVAEAAVCREALSLQPSVADLERSLPDTYIASQRADDGTGPTYGDLLDADGIAALSHATHGLIIGAADVSEWAVLLGAARLVPQEPFAVRSTTGGYEVAVQVAVSDEFTDADRAELLDTIRRAAEAAACRALSMKPAAQQGAA
jgi:hypothetical protein